MENTITVQGTSVFYRDEGTGSPIVILHGWGSRADSWREVQDDLARRGYRVVIPDLPGFGESEEPPSIWSLKEYSAFIRDFTAALKIDYCSLVGHSFGGRIAIDYTLRNPKRVRRLILCDAAGITRHKKLKTKIFLILTRGGNLIFQVPLLSFLKPLATKLWYVAAGERDYYRASSRMRQVMKKVLDENIRTYLPSIRQPTLILWGEKDVVTPLADAIIIHRSIPLTHLHVFPGIGHAIHLKNSQGVAREIARFLKNHS